MSSTPQNRSWGPFHQYRPPPGHGRGRVKLAVIATIVIAVELFLHRLGRPDPFGWTVHW